MAHSVCPLPVVTMIAPPGRAETPKARSFKASVEGCRRNKLGMDCWVQAATGAIIIILIAIVKEKLELPRADVGYLLVKHGPAQNSPPVRCEEES